VVPKVNSCKDVIPGGSSHGMPHNVTGKEIAARMFPNLPEMHTTTHANASEWSNKPQEQNGSASGKTENRQRHYHHKLATTIPQTDEKIYPHGPRLIQCRTGHKRTGEFRRRFFIEEDMNCYLAKIGHKHRNMSFENAHYMITDATH